MEFVWKRFLFKFCLLESCPSHLVWYMFFFRYIWVECFIFLDRDFSSNMFLVDVFHVFLLGVSFDKCFVEISLQRISGRHISSRTLLVEVCVGICLAQISLQTVLRREIVSRDFRKKNQRFCSRDPSFQSFGRECLFKDFWYGFFCRDFWEVISLHCFLRQNFILRDLLEEIPLQSFFGSRVAQTLF